MLSPVYAPHPLLLRLKPGPQGVSMQVLLLRSGETFEFTSLNDLHDFLAMQLALLSNAPHEPNTSKGGV